MKKRIRFLLAAMVLAGALTVPAAAEEQPAWRMSEQTFYGRFATEYAAAYPEEYEAFDQEACEELLAKSGYSAEELMENFQLDGETLRKTLWLVSLEDEALEKQAEKEYQAYITQAYDAAFPGEIDRVGLPWAMGIFGCESPAEFAEEMAVSEEEARNFLASCYVETRQMTAENHEKTLEYRAQYPGSYESFDPDYGYDGYWAFMKGNNMARYGLQNEEEWKEYMYVRYMPEGYLSDQEEARKREEYPRRWPEEYAAFDAYAWFAGYYHDISTPETYMEQEGLDAEGFRREFFRKWVDREECFFNGCCVTVNGTPIQFQYYRDTEGEIAGPKVEQERILIPLRAAAEALGLTVEWKEETGQVVCSSRETAVTFTLGSTEYSGGTLDVAPCAEKGVTYLPLRALGEALGCGVEWKQDFATAALSVVK